MLGRGFKGGDEGKTTQRWPTSSGPRRTALRVLLSQPASPRAKSTKCAGVGGRSHPPCLGSGLPPLETTLLGARWREINLRSPQVSKCRPVPPSGPGPASITFGLPTGSPGALARCRPRVGAAGGDGRRVVRQEARPPRPPQPPAWPPGPPGRLEETRQERARPRVGLREGRGRRTSRARPSGWRGRSRRSGAPERGGRKELPEGAPPARASWGRNCENFPSERGV